MDWLIKEDWLFDGLFDSFLDICLDKSITDDEFILKAKELVDNKSTEED